MKGSAMNLTPEQIAAAQKANLETLSGLTNQALQSIEKLVELNLAIAKQSLSDSVNNAKKALEVKDIQQLLAHQAETVQPIAEKIISYSRHLYELARLAVGGLEPNELAGFQQRSSELMGQLMERGL